MGVAELTFGLSLLVGVAALLGIVTYFVPIGPWRKARSAGISVDLFQVAAMRFRRVDPRAVVEAAIRCRRGGVDVSFNQLEVHLLAGGNLPTTVEGLVAARQAGREVPFETAAALDLGGFDVRQELLHPSERGREFLGL